jgi:hypothetical protein
MTASSVGRVVVSVVLLLCTRSFFVLDAAIRAFFRLNAAVVHPRRSKSNRKHFHFIVLPLYIMNPVMKLPSRDGDISMKWNLPASLFSNLLDESSRARKELMKFVE